VSDHPPPILPFFILGGEPLHERLLWSPGNGDMRRPLALCAGEAAGGGVSCILGSHKTGLESDRERTKPHDQHSWSQNQFLWLNCQTEVMSGELSL
jgi:hypothetical protein